MVGRYEKPQVFGPAPLRCWCCGQQERTQGCVRGFSCLCYWWDMCGTCHKCAKHCICPDGPGQDLQQAASRLLASDYIKTALRLLGPFEVAEDTSDYNIHYYMQPSQAPDCASPYVAIDPMLPPNTIKIGENTLTNITPDEVQP